MSDILEKFADGLVEEVMADMADNFFGERKRLEEDIEAFQVMVGQLRDVSVSVALREAFLNHLLLGGCGEFYQAVGAGGVFLPGEDLVCADVLPASLPRALTPRRAWTKLVLLAYSGLVEACDAYQNGRYYVDHAARGAKRLTVHYRQLKERAAALNERIRKANTEMSPVCMLQYVKSFDPGAVEKERVTGAVFQGYACSLDEKLGFRPIDFSALHLMQPVALPATEEVRGRIEGFCRDLWASNKSALKAMMRELRAGKAG